MDTFTANRIFTVLECAACHMQFAMTQAFENSLRSDRSTFYCPRGHSNWFPGQTDKDRAQKLAGQLDMAETRTREAREESARLAKRLDY